MKAEKKETLRTRVKFISVVLKFSLLLAILVGLPLYVWFFHQDLLRQFSDIDEVKIFFTQ